MKEVNIMTKNQLDYLGLVETKRNNIVVANESKRHSQAVEHETRRNNIVNSDLARSQLEETKRSNLRKEDQQDRNLDEIGRHNLVTEQQGQASLEETAKHNRASEKQAKYATDTQARTSRKVAKINAKAQQSNAKTAAKAAKYSADSARKASKYAADSSAAASKFNALTSKATQLKKIAADIQQTNTKLLNDKVIAEMQDKTTKYVSGLKAIIDSSNASEAAKAKYAQIAADIQNNANSVDAQNYKTNMDAIIKGLGAIKHSDLIKSLKGGN
nr:putative ORF1 [Marmot picobirnavirus]